MATSIAAVPKLTPVSPTSPPSATVEPPGPGQSLQAAGVLAICAASLQPEPQWLRNYLSRTLSKTSGLRLHSGARTALIEQALEISQSTDARQRAPTALHGYLSAASFAPNSAAALLSSILYADVVSATSYDSRAREALMRAATALRLPPRSVLVAEATLAALLRSVEANATAPDGANVEAVGEDDEHARKRRSLRWLKVGAAGVVGGLALGISGGLIAPALLPALSTVGLASVSAPLAALGSSGAVAVGGLFGAAGAGVGAAAMVGRTGVVEEFRFEACDMYPTGTKQAGYSNLRVTPSRRVEDITVAADAEGGLLVWEILTTQEQAIPIPGVLGFAVGMRDSRSGADGKIEWLLPEERMEVGGVERLTGGVRRRRSTGAITSPGKGTYVLRFRLLPGSLPARISYRVALIPPGRDPPLWVMDNAEDGAQANASGVGSDPIRGVGAASAAKSLSVTLFVPGIFARAENGVYPGMCAEQFSDTATTLGKYDVQSFAVRWDAELILELSDALRRLVGQMTLSMAVRSGAALVVPALVSAVALPVSVIAAVRTLIGNIWAKTLAHATEAGYMLACELAARSFGNRPVSLAGYSAGAQVIFACLRELARRNLSGIVHDVCLMGAPCTADTSVWREIRSVVSGRLINVYNPHDWYLELYHRGTNLGAVAGTRSIQDPGDIANVENFCLEREQLGSHVDYAKQSGEILRGVGFGDPEQRRPWAEVVEIERTSAGNSEDEQGTEEWGGTADKAFSGETMVGTTADHDDGEDVLMFERRVEVRKDNSLPISGPTSA